jgi:enoyl-CoA hydratase
VTSPFLTYTLEEKTAVVHMDDGKANALSDGMITALLEALNRAESEASAMVLLGRKDRFCAGFDLKAMMASADSARALLRRGSDLLMRLYGASIPLVIACEGHALAGGALVLLTADLRLGAQGDYRVGLNEVAIGLPVPVLAMELARDRLATTELTKATQLATIFGAEDAARVGYLDSLEGGDVVAKAKSEAARLGALPRRAFKATKERLRGKTIAHIRSTLEEDLATLL